jgi:methyl-accepting chemotaxis protein
VTSDAKLSVQPRRGDFFGRIWYWLTEPHDSIPDGEPHRRARLNSGLLFAVLALGLPLVALIVLESSLTEGLVAVVCIALVGGAYLLSRTRYYMPSAIIITAIFPVSAFLMTAAGYMASGAAVDVAGLYFLASGMLIAGMLLSVAWTVAIGLLLLAGMIGLVVLVGVPFELIVGPFAFNIFTGMLIMIIAVMRAQDTGQIEAQVAELTTAERKQQALAQREQQLRERLEATVTEYMAFVRQVGSGELQSRLRVSEERAAWAADVTGDPLTVLGVGLNDMVDNLTEIVVQMITISGEIEQASTEIMSATSQQAAAAMEQNAAVTQTVTTVTQVESVVNQTADRAGGVAEMAQASVDVSEKGLKAIAESIEGMQVIRERVEDIAQTILALSEKTQQIGSIISTVNEIADQSKLLALNASIEAARAGEEGRGFRVVAMEVRSLAEQSRQATEQVRAILGEIQAATNTAVMATEEGIKGVDNGQVLIDRAGQTIEDLTTTILQASQSTTQIASSTQQQSGGMAQLVHAMQTIQQASVQTRASIEQTEASVENLNNMAQLMQSTISRYRL